MEIVSGLTMPQFYALFIDSHFWTFEVNSCIAIAIRIS